jgi:hypothetical protein
VKRHECVLIVPKFKPGDQPPAGYLEWHDWADVQHRAGIRQSKCDVCGLWRYPQEVCCNAPRTSIRAWKALVSEAERAQARRERVIDKALKKAGLPGRATP